MVPVVGQRPHRRFAVLSTVVKATVASVEFAAVLLADRAQHQRLTPNSDFENEIVAVKRKQKHK